MTEEGSRRDIHKVTLEQFGIEPSNHDGCIVLRLSGIGDMVAVDAIREILEAVRYDVDALTITSVEVDIRQLQLLTSSCLKLFAAFLLDIVSKKLECPVRFIVDGRQPWQARSLFALERLATSIVSVVPR